MPTSAYEDLPLDIHFNILSRLRYSYNSSPDLHRTRKASAHTFTSLAATSKTLCNAVTSYSIHQLESLHNKFEGRVPRPPYTRKQVPRIILARHVSRGCVLCGTDTVRVAIMNHEILCCKECDSREWPNKITMTDAMKNYILPKKSLLENVYHSNYKTQGIIATMLFEDDVKAFANDVHHNDIEGIREKKASASAAMRARKIEREKEKRIYLRELLVANNIDPIIHYDHLAARLPQSPRQIVRNYLLEKRVMPGFLNKQQELLDKGYCNKAGGHLYEYPVVKKYGKFDYHIDLDAKGMDRKPIRNAKDEALAELFVAQFGGEITPLSYAAWRPGRVSAAQLSGTGKWIDRSMWKTLDGIGPKSPPWAFEMFPVFVETPAPVIDEDEVDKTREEKEEAGKKRRKIEKQRSAEQKEMGDVGRVIRKVIAKGGLQGPPHWREVMEQVRGLTEDDDDDIL